MKIALITTYPDAPEVSRIKEEALVLGHSLTVINFEKFGFSILHNTLTLKEITDLDVDMVIIRGIFTAMKALTPLINYFKSKGIKVFDNNLSVHKYAIDKTADFMKLALAGLPMPDTYYSRSKEDFASFGQKLGFPVVVKSVRMGKGASVVKFDTQEELDVYLQQYLEEGKVKDLVMQQFIDYKFDLRIFVLGDKMFSMRRIPSNDDFRANFSLGGSVELFELSDSLRELSRKAIEAVDLQIAGVDILLDADNNPYILEVNHTPGMLGIETATGENISNMYLQFAIENAA